MTKPKTKPSCHAELVSASYLVFFLPLADTPFIPVHRAGFSGVILIKNLYLIFFKKFFNITAVELSQPNNRLLLLILWPKLS